MLKGDRVSQTVGMHEGGTDPEHHVEIGVLHAGGGGNRTACRNFC